jgi:tRNA modification GTPase
VCDVSVCSPPRSPSTANAGARAKAEELNIALEALGQIYGAVDMEEMLDVVFRDFCIGK